MSYIFIIILLVAFQLLYFRIAKRFNIVDLPNKRSSHSKVTLRGGGMIFWVGILLYFILIRFEYPWFFLGLTLMAAISFLDDLFSVSNKLRLLIHLFSVYLMFYELELLNYPLWILIVSFIVVIGTINAYNFMDGINGITAAYSIAILILLAIVNEEFRFIDMDIIYISMIATTIFSFFNFRKTARCFAGDVGSVSMSFILIFLTIKLIIDTQNIIYILFFLVYGIDTVWTIVQRLLRKENIFKAHRSHLYQYLSNEAGVNKLMVSAAYGLLQFLIGVIVINIDSLPKEQQILFSLGFVILLSLIYFFLKKNILKKYKIVE
ncbi:MAG: glycosyltransferase family 4 protein [Ferruginibacter sp.]